MSTKKYPIGVQVFSKIIEGKYQYVDKTGYVFDLVQRYQTVFLSRPRRFGKSLLTSTLHCYFDGRKELFEGLEISRLEQDWVKYPVLHFDMSSAKHKDKEELIWELEGKLADYEEIYGRKDSDKTTNQRLEGLIQSAHKQTGRQVVVLIDEYDAPLLDVLGDKDELEEHRQIMRNFFSPLKPNDEHLRFVFITGITKFSQVSIFSELNSLKNISMLPEFSGICGITSEELVTQFSDDVDDFAARLRVSRDEALAKLADNYDGYHFSEESPDVYNPYSLINALSDGRIKRYWFSTGTPTYLIERMRHFKVQPQQIGKIIAAESDFDAPTENMKSITPLLYQSGYLTIKGYRPISGAYTLDLPNREVRAGLMESLVSYVADDRYSQPANGLLMKMQDALYEDDIDAVMQGFKVFFSSIPYSDNPPKNSESFYQTLMYVIFSMMCQYTDVEVRTPRGRADLVINARNKIYVIELKINKDASFALDQINLNDYGERFLIQGKPVVKVGVTFDAEGTRNITGYEILE